MEETSNQLFEKETRNLPMLIVESNGALRRNIKRSLKEAGVGNVVEAEGTRDAVMAIKTQPDIAVILCGHKLPDGDGLKFLLSIHQSQKHPNTTLILASAQHQEEFIKKVLAAGIDGYLGKPFPFDEVRPQIEKAIENHRYKAALKNLVLTLDMAVQLTVDKEASQGKCIELSRKGCTLSLEEPCGFGATVMMRLPRGADAWFAPLQGSVKSVQRGEQGESLAKVEFTGKRSPSQGVEVYLKKAIPGNA